MPDVGVPRGAQSVEIYKAISGAYCWRVLAVAEDASEDALRAAKALALEIEDEIRSDLRDRSRRRRAEEG